ncbi:TPA: DivIVA domain-containing protein [Streptococcus suis]|uniref:DivIVA domain-containing protein n=1 Tax=Streptococcus suivaginalis TaxID=3028082 RepID=A0AA96VG15_9STRE|nr:DivIVA domain-containing protein [Streptococcus sp. 29896]MBM7315489.1 DivIVA domain-containing protein [Streptococcus suis]MCK4028544.1 DivIVA domain-containing protein [Streptococcus suis]WNY47566.1 DivIVA domain-containing protein [Streptococcus sp. 29896]
MALTSLELKDKTFGTKFRGYNQEEVDEFLDMVTVDYEDLVRTKHEQESEIKSLKERLAYFDQMKESLSQSVLLAQDTADKVKVAAEDRAANIIKQADYDAQALLNEAKDKANEILRTATDNAKKVAVETEELKNKTRIFHQRLKSTVESQLSIINSSDWEEILRPTATYLQTSDEAFREVLESALEEKVEIQEEDGLDVTRQLSPEEVAELKRQAAALEAEEAAAADKIEIDYN